MKSWCTGKTSYGFECGNPARFKVHVRIPDEKYSQVYGTCGKHLAQVVEVHIFNPRNERAAVVVTLNSD